MAATALTTCANGHADENEKPKGVRMQGMRFLLQSSYYEVSNYPFCCQCLRKWFVDLYIGACP